MGLWESNSKKLPVALVKNRADAYVSPSAAVFPYYFEELPASIASPDWNKLQLSMSGMSQASCSHL